MSSWLLDTNVLSAFAPGKPPVDGRHVHWFTAHASQMFLSVITVSEVEAGVRYLRRKGSTRKASQLAIWFGEILEDYGERILPFDLAAAMEAGTLSDAATALGRHPGFADIAIAATARAQGLELLTRNLRHFEALDISVRDPFA